MGNKCESTSFRPGVASDFYWPCRNGNVHKVTQMIPSMTYEEISVLQANGSTALHAASFNGHERIVKILLDRGCNRSTLNRNSLTAYQEAKNDEIRNLFKRPDSAESRYASRDVNDLFQLQSEENVENIPDNWVRGHSTASEATDAQFIAAAYRSTIFRKLIQKKTEADFNTVLQELIQEKVVAAHHPEASKINDFLEKFLRRDKHSVDHLIRMYTMETPFYSALHDDNSAFTSVLYMHLHEYRDRVFKGRSYRGAAMTIHDIEAYRWAQENKSRVLETCSIQSTSLEKDVAEHFAKLYATVDKHTVLFIFDFPDKCQTAIALSQISEKLRSLSDFENESEVLILPYTLFQVTDIKINRQTKWYQIFLTNVPVPNKSVFNAWLQAFTDNS